MSTETKQSDTVTISREVYDAYIKFTLSHEYEITVEKDGFAELLPVYKQFLGAEAQLEKLSGKTGYCTECERLGRENKELREAVIDYIANLTADTARKTCGHEFQCVCSGDRLNKTLSGGG